MFDFFKSLFKGSSPSGETAKERLRLVLLSDHLSLAPDVVESLKRDLMEVISRYVEIDSANADVTFEHREREIAMLASIPITGVRERRAAQAPPPLPRIAAAPAVESALPAEPVSLARLTAVAESAAAPATERLDARDVTGAPENAGATDVAKTADVGAEADADAAAALPTVAAVTEPSHPAPSRAVAKNPDLGLDVAPATASAAPRPKPKPKTPPGASGAPAHASNAGTPRRRRRKKYAAATAAAASKRAASQPPLGGQASAQA